MLTWAETLELREERQNDQWTTLSQRLNYLERSQSTLQEEVLLMGEGIKQCSRALEKSIHVLQQMASAMNASELGSGSGSTVQSDALEEEEDSHTNRGDSGENDENAWKGRENYENAWEGREDYDHAWDGLQW